MTAFVAGAALALSACGGGEVDRVGTGDPFAGYSVTEGTLGSATHVVDAFPAGGTNSPTLPQVKVAALSMSRETDDEQDLALIVVTVLATNGSEVAVSPPYFSLWCGDIGFSVRGSDASGYQQSTVIEPGDTDAGMVVFVEEERNSNCKNLTLFAAPTPVPAEGESRHIVRWHLTG